MKMDDGESIWSRRVEVWIKKADLMKAVVDAACAWADLDLHAERPETIALRNAVAALRKFRVETKE